MAAIVWNNVGERFFETGLDRGVLFFPEGGGVAWNGLIAVEEENTSSVESVHYDGVKFNDLVTVGDFAATLRAYTYPDEFLRFEGTREDQTGVLITGQPPERFNLSYRSLMGSDVDAQSNGYKIHILYNLTAIPATKEYRTLSLDVEPMEFEWSLTSIPEDIEGYLPTAHIILDTRTMDPLFIEDLEAVLYGDEENDPRIPSLKGLISFLRKWDRLVIIDNGDGSWTAIDNTGNYIDSATADEFEITSDTAIFLNSPTNTIYRISSSEKNEEDL
jgi:hypothetical protein